MDKVLRVCIENDTIKCIVDEKNYENKLFAFYILLNDRPIVKTGYGKENKYSLQLTENGIYSVTAFVMDSEREKTIISSPKYRYIKKYKSSEYIRIEEIELTNNCNLTCENCCTPKSKYARGYIDYQTFMSAMSWMQEGQTVNYHRIGEPLLHPQICDFVKYGVWFGKIRPIISTNGILLTKEILNKLVTNGLRMLVITLHTKKSVKAFKMAVDYFEEHNIKVLPFEQMHKKVESSLSGGGDVFFW